MFFIRLEKENMATFMLLSRLVGTELLGDRQAALCSVCIVGFYASVRLMVSWRHLVGDGDGIDGYGKDLLQKKWIRIT